MFWDLAAGLARLSRCRRLSVGAVVLRPDLSEVLAVGYNGPAAGLPNDSCRGAEGACGCVHAEANALVKLRAGAGGLVLLTTHSPCEHCAGLVVNSGRVGWVVHGEPYRDRRGLDVLAAAGVVAVGWREWVGTGGLDEKTPGVVPGVVA